jgi:chromosomal replication initiation ATPase DnaA
MEEREGYMSPYIYPGIAQDTPDRIINFVCQYYKVELNQISGGVDRLKTGYRSGRINLARHIAVYMIRNMTDLTLVQIGYLFNRKHSTILPSLRNTAGLLEVDERFRNEYNVLVTNYELFTNYTM